MDRSIQTERGFTLIELLVTIAIVGILAAIAIPQYASYKQRGYDARARSDLRNAIAAQEALFVDSEAYVACDDSGCNDPVLPGFQISDGVSISMVPAGDGQSFTASSSHPLGNDNFEFDSSDGTIQRASGSGGGDEGGIGGS